MKLLRYIFVLACLYVAMDATAQSNNTAASPATINKTDAKGSRHGIWVVNMPERMGEEPYSEFGSYNHGVKFGSWYKLDEQGELLAMEAYKNDVLDGEAKYFDKGYMVASGEYRGLNPARERDTFMVEDPVTGAQSLKSISTERGTVRHGTWRFYDPATGRLIREEEYQVDDLIFSKEFPMSIEDSVYYQKRTAKMPHVRSTNYYKPPSAKQIRY